MAGDRSDHWLDPLRGRVASIYNRLVKKPPPVAKTKPERPTGQRTPRADFNRAVTPTVQPPPPLESERADDKEKPDVEKRTQPARPSTPTSPKPPLTAPPYRKTPIEEFGFWSGSTADRDKRTFEQRFRTEPAQATAREEMDDAKALIAEVDRKLLLKQLTLQRSIDPHRPVSPEYGSVMNQRILEDLQEATQEKWRIMQALEYSLSEIEAAAVKVSPNFGPVPKERWLTFMPNSMDEDSDIEVDPQAGIIDWIEVFNRAASPEPKGPDLSPPPPAL